jgi:hypothetical protein
MLHLTAVAGGVDEGEAVESIRAASDDSCNLTVGNRIFGVKSRENHGLLDTCFNCATHMIIKGGLGIPWTGKPITLSCVAVAIDDHESSLDILAIFIPITGACGAQRERVA